jgi:hypothetical protein
VNRRLVIGLVIASVLGALGAWLELRPTDETLISDMVERLVADAERRDVGAMAPYVSDHYHDGRGLGREEVLQALGAYLKSQTWSRILPVRLSLGRIENDRAEATAKVILADAGGSPQHRRARDAVEIDLQLARESGRWRVLSAEEWEVPTEDAVMLP